MRTGLKNPTLSGHCESRAGPELGDFIYSYVSHQRNQSANQSFFPELGSPGFPEKVAPIPELFLFAAARAQLVFPGYSALHFDRDEIIICDRFVDSTTAYQGYGRGLPQDQVTQINEIATRGVKPDLTILLDIDPEKALTEFPGAGSHGRRTEAI